MKLFSSALVLLPAVLVMAEEPAFLNASSVTAKHASPICDGLIARLAVFGIHANAKVCLNASLTKLLAHVKIPSTMTCAEAVAAAKILGIKADVKVCVTTGSHGKKNGKVYGKRGDDYISIMHNKPPVQPPTKPGKPCKPSKPLVKPPTYEKPPCKTCKPPKPPVKPPTYEKPPCKTCKPPKPPVYPPVSTIRPPTPGKPCSPKSCKAIIAKIRTVCGTDIDINFCLDLRVNIDFLRLDSLKCRMIVGAAQIAGVSVDLSVCNRLDGRARNDYNDRSHPHHNGGYGHGGDHRNNEARRYHY